MRPVSRPAVVIFTAIRTEHRAIAHALAARPAGRDLSRGHRCGTDVEVQTVGIGARRLPSALPPGTCCVVLAGLAGGLDPGLRVGEVVLDGPPGLANAGAVRERSIVCGSIYTSPCPVTTPADKADLFRSTRAVAVDMEASAVRRLADAAGLPFIHLRAISDAAGDAIDPSVMALVDETGRPRLLPLAAYACRHPGRLAALARLGRSAAVGVGRVANAVCALLPALADLGRDVLPFEEPRPSGSVGVGGAPSFRAGPFNSLAP